MERLYIFKTYRKHTSSLETRGYAIQVKKFNRDFMGLIYFDFKSLEPGTKITTFVIL